MIICPNNTPIRDTPKFYDKGGNEFILPEGAKIAWTAGDTSLASLVVDPSTRFADIVPLRTAVGTYTYSYTYTDPVTGPVTVDEQVTYENPFPVAGKSFQVLSSQNIGGN